MSSSQLSSGRSGKAKADKSAIGLAGDQVEGLKSTEKDVSSFLHSLSLGNGDEELENNQKAGGSTNRLQSIEEIIGILRIVVEGKKTEKSSQLLTEYKGQEKVPKDWRNKLHRQPGA